MYRTLTRNPFRFKVNTILKIQSCSSFVKILPKQIMNATLAIGVYPRLTLVLVP